MIKLVLLDFDDTLCLTESVCWRIENELAGKMGFTPMTHETHLKNWGKPLQIAIEERIPGIDGDEFMHLMDKELPKYIEAGTADKISSENLDILRKLRDKKKKVGILTSRSLSEIRHLLDNKHPLSQLTDAFYHKDNLEYLKPDPRVFTDALYQFDCLPDEVIYVGDAVSDAMAAKGAGLHFIAVLEAGIWTKGDFTGQHVDFFANKFTDILPYILSH